MKNPIEAMMPITPAEAIAIPAISPTERPAERLVSIGGDVGCFSLFALLVGAVLDGGRSDDDVADVDGLDDVDDVDDVGLVDTVGDVKVEDELERRTDLGSSQRTIED
ncbi:hypothetical protein P152DRAFT_463033 [Eremomyces bilateralis CBS 781.70]|uniref:Uncharacterized protein n=1 Tax=Eremomyces bilateralis CBS 781.70 TaxID=1392243 RepID=A0A6G1FQE8_9PEZI|nr:uncharacterized protein P152DRAFT_463033 [Eremomyces bilateralis CBS 781.70]KAF1807930.1 hypothetical protein P152DRAFT_463033 [Eremomyces bilateralis CBS 781.70]